MVVKLCPHIMGNTPLALGFPPVAKIVNADIVGIAALRARVGTNCLIVVRWVEQDQPLDNPRQRAREWYSRRIWGREAQLAALKPLVIEGYNEVPDEQAWAYATFEMERLDLLHYSSLNGAVLSSGVGTPDFPIWDDYYESVIAAMHEGDVLSIHEYWVDYADILNPYHVLRFDKTPWLRDVPKIITECGRDIVEGQGRAGYRLTTNDEGFLQDLRRLDTLIKDRSDILGACLFTFGDDPRWANFRVDELWPKVVAEMESVPIPPLEPTSPTKFLWSGRLYPQASDLFLYLEMYISQEWIKQVHTIYLHHTTGLTTAWRADESMEGLRHWFWKGMNWDRGPHLFIAPDGIWVGTPLIQDGIGVSGHNHNTLHIEIVGNYDEEELSPVMYKRLLDTLHVLMRFTIPNVQIKAHQQDQATRCPGMHIMREWTRIIHDAYRPTPEPPPEEEDEEDEDEDEDEEALPSDEALGDTAKLQWFLEEATRQIETNTPQSLKRARAILLDAVTWIGNWPPENEIREE